MSLTSVLDIAGTGMNAQSIRLNTTASNIANAESASSSVDETYRARKPWFAVLEKEQSNINSKDEAFIIKAADVICAYLKTLEELSAGNREFEIAKKRLDKILKDYRSDEVNYFLDAFVPSFSLSLDEISQEES